jgi:hypothetical protein
MGDFLMTLTLSIGGVPAASYGAKLLDLAEPESMTSCRPGLRSRRRDKLKCPFRRVLYCHHSNNRGNLMDKHSANVSGTKGLSDLIPARELMEKWNITAEQHQELLHMTR